MRSGLREGLTARDRGKGRGVARNPIHRLCGPFPGGCEASRIGTTVRAEPNRIMPVDILFEPTTEDGPAAPAPFRFLAAGTFTGGKSFWLGTADGTCTGCSATETEKSNDPALHVDRPSRMPSGDESPD